MGILKNMEYYIRLGTKGIRYSSNEKGCKYTPIGSARYVFPVDGTNGKRINGLFSLVNSSKMHITVYERDVIKGYQEHFLENSNIKIWEF